MKPTTTKENDTGIMHTITSGGITCYDLFTYAGKYRGGKIYSTDKKYIVLSGKCSLTQEIDGKDVVIYITPLNGIFEIKSTVPHIFYFPEDTRMIEWFTEGSKSQDFERYRAMKK